MRDREAKAAVKGEGLDAGAPRMSLGEYCETHREEFLATVRAGDRRLGERGDWQVTGSAVMGLLDRLVEKRGEERLPAAAWQRLVRSYTSSRPAKGRHLSENLGLSRTVHLAARERGVSYSEERAARLAPVETEVMRPLDPVEAAERRADAAILEAAVDALWTAATGCAVDATVEAAWLQSREGEAGGAEAVAELGISRANLRVRATRGRRRLSARLQQDPAVQRWLASLDE